MEKVDEYLEVKRQKDGMKRGGRQGSLTQQRRALEDRELQLMGQDPKGGTAPEADLLMLGLRGPGVSSKVSPADPLDPVKLGNETVDF